MEICLTKWTLMTMTDFTSAGPFEDLIASQETRGQEVMNHYCLREGQGGPKTIQSIKILLWTWYFTSVALSGSLARQRYGQLPGGSEMSSNGVSCPTHTQTTKKVFEKCLWSPRERQYSRHSPHFPKLTAAGQEEDIIMDNKGLCKAEVKGNF